MATDLNPLVSVFQSQNQLIAKLISALGAAYAVLAGNNAFTGNNTFAGTSTFNGAAAFNDPASFTDGAAFTLPPQLPVYTVSGLPSVTLSNVGSVAFASNARNTGEGGGSGTGALVQVQNKSGTATWCATWSGVAATA